MIKLTSRNRGAASLITVIFVSIILSVLVMGFVRVGLDETRRSTDDDLTTRAFYAAESGIEDAKRAIRRHLAELSGSFDLNETDCSLPTGYDGELSVEEDFDVAYTCMLIDLTPSNFEVSLAPNQTKQIELNPEGGTAFDTLRLQWHINADLPDGDGANPPLRTNTPPSPAVPKSQLPRVDLWYEGLSTNTYPAMIRANLFSYPNGNFTASNVDNSAVAFLNPTSSQSDGPITHNAGSSRNFGLHEANCNSGVQPGDFVCTQIFNGFNSSNNYVLRLTSLYTSTHISITLLSGGAGGTPVGLEGVQAIVDVTGRAGDVFRRVEARLSLQDIFADTVPEYTIITAEDICKNMVVGSNAASSTANNCAN